MNRILDPLRNVLRELVDRRLWPVALALVAALIAVPVLLGGGDADVSPPPAGSAETAQAPARPAVELKADSDAQHRRPGKLRDPFYAPPKADAATVSTSQGSSSSSEGSSSAGSGSGGSSDGAGSGGGSGTGGGGGAPTRDAPVAPAPKRKPAGTFSAATVDLRFGETGSVKALRDVRRLSPLPSAKDPFFVFDGVLRGTRTARFTVSEAVRATGDGVCRPSKAACRSIDVRPGHSVYFDLTLADGTTKQFQLDVVSAGGSAAAASAAARSVYRTRVRLGSASGAPTHDLARLSAVGGVAAPALQYLGVGSDRRSAIFVLGPGATLASRNACLDGAPCRIIALGRGDHTVVNVGQRRYRVQVAQIRRVVRGTRAAALRARRAAAVGGRSLLRRMIADPTTATALGGIGFSAETGTVARH